MKTGNKAIHRKTLTLGDLVGAVASCAQSNREAVAALVDLLESGRVRLKSGNKIKRVHICGA